WKPSLFFQFFLQLYYYVSFVLQFPRLKLYCFFLYFFFSHSINSFNCLDKDSNSNLSPSSNAISMCSLNISSSVTVVSQSCSNKYLCVCLSNSFIFNSYTSLSIGNGYAHIRHTSYDFKL